MFTSVFTRLVLPFFIILTILSGCSKEEGPGGTSSIRGKVIVYDYDGSYQLLDSIKGIYPARNEKVFIIYGDDDNTYDDDFNTSYDGTYEFKFLQKGSYHLFVYSNDSSAGAPPKVKIPVKIDVEITDKGSTVTAPDMIILDNNN